MAIELADLFRMQLDQQAILYNLTYSCGRRKSAERVEKFFYRILTLLPITHTLEIGAHEATFSKTVRGLKNAPITIRAFEANPLVASHYMFDKNIRASGIEYINTAIGDKNGSWPFTIYDTIAGKAIKSDSRRQSCMKRADCEDLPAWIVNVPIAKLDTLCEKDPESSIYALWIDAEGFSREVLLGADKLLKQTDAIYIELESALHFQNQALDKEIIGLLLEKGFIPILRDFLFPHQYNAIFIKKTALPLIEHEWHRYYQAVLRQELAASFDLKLVSHENIRQAPPQIRPHTATSVEEIQEMMASLPILRETRERIDPCNTLVVCHYEELSNAIQYYKGKYDILPSLLPFDLPEEAHLCQGVKIESLSGLNQNRDIQLFFKGSRYPGKTRFAQLALKLHEAGIRKYHIESSCLQDFYLRNSHVKYKEEEWQTILNFYNLLADSLSKYTYLAICKARMDGEPGYIPLSDFPQYAHPLVHACPGDIIIEGGCCPVFEEGRGWESSTENFLGEMKGTGEIWCFEPVEATCAELRDGLCAKGNVRVENLALWSGQGTLSLIGEGDSAYTMATENGDCKCTDADGFFADKNLPSLIKLDVEGSELEVLKGAQNLITKKKPKLMLSIYHSRPAKDWIRLPNFLMKAGWPYEYYCAHHRPWFNESVVYARRKPKRT